MLAIIKTAKSVRASLKYNEKKIEENQARLLDAHNFWQEKHQLSVRDKLQRFHDLTVLNERSQKHGVHISLNFPPGDLLADRQMVRIATDFMHGIGFAEQPWLVYRHVDAAHPHMHIVTTNIQRSGSRIRNDDRSPDHLKKLCFALEEKYALNPAIRMPDLFNEEPAPERSKRSESALARYGEFPTKTEITRILNHVIHRYSYTSFDSFNAILWTYRVWADRGREGAVLYKNRGLYYRMIDQDGNKIGAPIKASAFPLPVTLSHLEEKFRLNEAKAKEAAESIRRVIDWHIFQMGGPYSLAIFKDELRKEGIGLFIPDLHRKTPRLAAESPRKPDDGHGIFYISHAAKIGVRDTDLGEAYTAAAILRRTGVEQDIRRLAIDNRLPVTKTEQGMLDRSREQDPAVIRRVLFRLSAGHDDIVEQKLIRKEEQERSLHRGRGLSI